MTIEPEAKSFLELASCRGPRPTSGAGPRAKDDVLSRYAVSFIPTYILIGPDGKLVLSGRRSQEIGRFFVRRGRYR